MSDVDFCRIKINKFNATRKLHLAFNVRFSIPSDGVVVNATTQLHSTKPATTQHHSTKPELRFCAGSNPARGMSEICDGEDLWQWSRLEIRLSAFCGSSILQKQFIIIWLRPCIHDFFSMVILAGLCYLTIRIMGSCSRFSWAQLKMREVVKKNKVTGTLNWNKHPKLA